MRVHFVIHEEFEGSGAFDNWVTERGYEATYTRAYQLEIVPQQVDVFDLLVVLGGSQSPSTTKDACAYFDAAAEINLIQKAIGCNIAVVGVCLGAQLIGEALGAKCEHSPHQEIGCFPISLTTQGQQHEKFKSFPSQAIVGHWHNDMPGLTSTSQVLATSQGCPRQIIQYSNLVYGFQCHLEFTKMSVESLIAYSLSEFQLYQDRPFIQTPEELGEYDFYKMNKLLFIFLDELMLDYRRSIHMDSF